MTKPIFIDFARDAYHSPSLFGRIGVSLSAFSFMCLLGLILSWQLYQKHHAQIQTRQQLVNLTQIPVTKKPDIHASPVKPAEQTIHATTLTLMPVFHAIQRPWESLLDNLAESTPAAIVLLSVTPSASKQSLSLEGEAINLPSLFAYVEHLQAIPQLEQLHLKQHAQLTEGEYRPIHFILEAEWKP